MTNVKVKDQSDKPADKPEKDTVYVDVEDDITAVIDKVEATKSKIIALVLPKRAAALQSIVNMRLLKKGAESAGKSIILITNETSLLPLAGAVGLHLAKNLHSKPYIPPSPLATKDTPAPAVDSIDEEVDEKNAKLDYHRSIGELATTEGLDEPEAIALDDSDESPIDKSDKTAKVPKNKRLKVPNFDRFRLWLGLGIAAFIGLIVFIILAVAVLPKASITIKTESSKVAASFNLSTDAAAKELDMAKTVIPAQLATNEQVSNQQVPATGQQNNGERAKGAITLKNCGGSSVTVPAGAGVSSSGLTFITQKAVTLNPGNFDIFSNCKSSGDHTGNTDVTAQLGGTKYNLASGSSFSVAGYSSVTGSNSSALSGGTDNISTVVSQADVENARSKVSTTEIEKTTKDFEQQLSDQGLYVIKQTIKLSEPSLSASPAVGQPASNVTVTVKITHSALTLKKDDLKKAVEDQLNKQIDTNKQKISTEDLIKDIEISVQSQGSPTSATLSIRQEGTAVPVIDINAVKQQAGGQKSGNIKDMISAWPGVKNVEVKLSPFWVSKAPKKAGKINVVLQEEKPAQTESPPADEGQQP